MSGAFLWTAGLLVLCGAAVVFGIVRQDVRYPRGDLGPRTPQWPPRKAPPRTAFTGTARPTPFQVTRAHRVMQQHRGCDIAECHHKLGAHQILVAVGHIRPAEGAHL